MEKITVKVPATSANLGSGFDCFGIAFQLYNTFSFEKRSEGVVFEGCAEHHKTLRNLAYVAYKAVCDRIGVPAFVKITNVDINVPISRGLGSSATLIVAGAYSANRLHGDPLSKEELLKICNEIEGHPDNIAPALYGGLCASLVQNGTPYTVRFPVSEKIRFTAVIPDFEVQTREARAVLPNTIPRADGIYNLSRTALLPTAFERGDFTLLSMVTRDKLHEQYRKKLFRNIKDVEKASYDCGAVSFMISGAGSTCLALSQNEIAPSLSQKLASLPNGWKCQPLTVDLEGVQEL